MMILRIAAQDDAGRRPPLMVAVIGVNAAPGGAQGGTVGHEVADVLGREMFVQRDGAGIKLDG